MQTPSVKPSNPPSSPASATKFVERSLHDLDDLIQQRRLELSALRKSNRKKLTEQFSVQSLKTPIQNRGNIVQILTSDFNTPKLNFDIIDEDLLSYATPVLDRVPAIAESKPLVHQVQQTDEDAKKIELLNEKIEELNSLYSKCLDEIDTLSSQVKNLELSCLEWENNTKVAAQSAFEWEAHSTAITQHYEQQLEEFQSANTMLIEENEKLEELLKNSISNNPSVAIDKPVDTAIVAPTTTSGADINKVSKLMQIFNQKNSLNERKLSLAKAFKIFKMNMYFQSTIELYKRKCAEYLKSKQEEYANGIAKDVRLLYQESSKAAVEVITKPESQTTFLLLLAFFQGLIWLVLILAGQQMFMSNEVHMQI